MIKLIIGIICIIIGIYIALKGYKFFVKNDFIMTYLLTISAAQFLTLGQLLILFFILI